MYKLSRNIAFIPARKGSKGFKHKNRRFFDHTADFIDQINWFDQVLVSSDDENIILKAKERNYTTHTRSQELSGPAVSIKSVLENVIIEMGLSANDYVWLFYLPVLYKNRVDFEEAKRILERENPSSLCTFIPAQTHPYNCWKYNKQNGVIEQYLPNDVFRRQDLPQAWMHYHYVYCSRVNEAPALNSELLNKRTYPFFLSPQTADLLIEIDTPEDYEEWKQLKIQ